MEKPILTFENRVYSTHHALDPREIVYSPDQVFGSSLLRSEQ